MRLSRRVTSAVCIAGVSLLVLSCTREVKKSPDESGTNGGTRETPVIIDDRQVNATGGQTEATIPQLKPGGPQSPPARQVHVDKAEVVKAMRRFHAVHLKVTQLVTDKVDGSKVFDAIKKSGGSAGDWIEAGLAAPRSVSIQFQIPFYSRPDVDLEKELGPFERKEESTFDVIDDFGDRNTTGVIWYRYGDVEIGTLFGPDAEKKPKTLVADVVCIRRLPNARKDIGRSLGR